MNKYLSIDLYNGKFTMVKVLYIYRDGRLDIGDEVLMVNGQSVAGYDTNDVTALLRDANIVKLVITKKVRISLIKKTNFILESTIYNL